MKRNLIILGLLSMSLNIYAESFDDFMSNMNSDYNGFVTQMDKDFAKSLGKE